MSGSGLSGRDRAAIAVGGVLGASCRWLIGEAIVDNPSDGGWFVYAPNTSMTFAPDNDLIAGRWGTVAANLIGCLLLGAVTTLLVRSSDSNRRLLLAAGTGFCGALTTFATFAVEALVLLRLGPLWSDLEMFDSFGESVGQAIAYVSISLIGGSLAFWVGRSSARQVTKT